MHVKNSRRKPVWLKAVQTISRVYINHIKKRAAFPPPPFSEKSIPPIDMLCDSK